MSTVADDPLPPASPPSPAAPGPGLYLRGLAAAVLAAFAILFAAFLIYAGTLGERCSDAGSFCH